MQRKFQLIGLGGAGCLIADQVHAVLGGRLAHINAIEDIASDRDNLTSIGLTTLRRGARDAEHAGQCAERAGDEIAALLCSASQVFLFVGLGGAIGTGAAPVVARMAVERGIEVVAVATLPFSYETHAGAVAAQAIAPLRALCTTMFIHDHASASLLADKAALSMNQSLAVAIAKAIESVGELIGAEA